MKSFVVMGNFRGGTTAIAGVLMKAGIEWSDNIDVHLEDLEIQKAFQDDDIATAAELIGANNYRYGKQGLDWGFKYPGAFLRISEWIDKMEDPHCIFVFRDPVAVSWSEHTRMGFDVMEMMHRTNDYNDQMTKVFQMCGDNQVKAICISYELLITRTRETVTQLFKWADIKSDPYECAGFVNKRTSSGQSYVESKELIDG